MKDYIKKTLEEFDKLIERVDYDHRLMLHERKKLKDFLKRKLKGIENLQRCDCCGKLKSGKFICGTCEDCI